MARLQAVPRRFRPVLDEIRDPRLLHGDLWEGNVLVGRQGGRKCVAALIDGDRSLFGDPAFETASGWMQNEDFARGCRLQRQESGPGAVRTLIYKLLYALLDSYIQLAEYGRPEESEKHCRISLDCLTRLAALDGGLPQTFSE